MPHRWEPCCAIMLIEGRGPVRCWMPPRLRQTLCSAHRPDRETATGEAELRSFMLALVRQIHPRADVLYFVQLRREAQCELRIEVPGVVAKWVTVPEGMIRRALLDVVVRRTLRAFLTTVMLAQESEPVRAEPAGRDAREICG